MAEVLIRQTCGTRASPGTGCNHCGHREQPTSGWRTFVGHWTRSGAKNEE